MILTIVIFIIILGLLVFVHEFGHFVVAKKSGMQVDEFGFGFPPRLFGFQKKAGKWAFVFGPRATQGPETVYSINMIPLGGFVKILGENNDQPDNPQSFARKPFFPRLFTLLAGVIMNVILAWVLISIGLMVGSPASVASRDEIPSGGKLKDVQVTVKDLLSGAPAQRAGIKVGDAVLDINGQSILTVPDMQEIVAASPATPLVFQIKRADQIVDITVTPDKNSETGKGSTGVVISLVGKLSYPWYKAPVIGAYNTWQALTSILKGLGGLFTGSIGVKQLGGPAKIAQLTGEASKLGMAYLLQFTAFLSLNLAVLNVLPFPALDGGRILFLLIEKLRRKPNNQTVEQAFNLVGFSLLILLMLVVTFNDIRGFGGLGTILGKIF